MPASLSRLSTTRARLTRTFDDGESFFIDYRPGQVTPRQVHRLQELQGRADDLSEAEQSALADEQTEMLAAMLIETNALDSQQRPIVCTLEGLQDVSYADQRALLTLILEDQQPGKVSASGPLPESSTPDSESQAQGQTTHTSHQSQSGTRSERRRSGSKSR